MESAFILASSSPFRKSILEKILPKFSTFSPDIDETPHVDEKPIDLVLRLGLEKAKAAERMYKQGIAIGSDQIALPSPCQLSKITVDHNEDTCIA